ncbi:hypothetical protein EON65_14660 [archaeon]|nr:MAG: hypothetical protein EON65_14660 [archaeon]
MNILLGSGNPAVSVGNTLVLDGDDSKSAATVAPSLEHIDEVKSIDKLQQGLRGSVDIIRENAVVKLGADKLGLSTALLIMASNRPDYLSKCLSFILQYHPNTAVPITISQDGANHAVNDAVDGFSRQFALKSTLPVKHLHHPRLGHYENGYFALADHYKWALNNVFADTSISHVIILEEDLQIAPDFFEFFAATQPIYDSDPSLLAVSAWNDNGFNYAVQDTKQLYRSDFFPGLGWMLSRRIWEELGPKWPKAYWDDWLREPAQRQSRQFIRPEVCRTLHYGARGVSNAQYSEFLTTIKLNSEYVHFTQLDLSYLSSQGKWEEVYFTAIRSAKQFKSARTFLDSIAQLNTKEVKILYTSQDGNEDTSFVSMAQRLGAMDNIKAHVPRTAYKGIVSFWYKGVKVHLVPVAFS